MFLLFISAMENWCCPHRGRRAGAVTMRAPKAKGKNPSPVGHESRPRGIGARGELGAGGAQVPLAGGFRDADAVPVVSPLRPNVSGGRYPPQRRRCLRGAAGGRTKRRLFRLGSGNPKRFAREPPRLCQDGAPGLSKLALLGTDLVVFFQQAELSAAFWEKGRGFPRACRGQVRC